MNLTKDEIMRGIESMQLIQSQNPPNSEKWLRASKVLHALATILNDGVPPKDAWGRGKR